MFLRNEVLTELKNTSFRRLVKFEIVFCSFSLPDFLERNSRFPYFLSSFFFFLFFCLEFLSRTFFTIHRTAGEVECYFFNAPLPFSLVSQTFRHYAYNKDYFAYKMFQRLISFFVIFWLHGDYFLWKKPKSAKSTKYNLHKNLCTS